MTSVYLLFICGLVAAIAALALSFVSAPSYDIVFFCIVFFDIVAMACLIYVFFSHKKWTIAVLLVSAIVAYSIIDVTARTLFHVRILDFL